MKCEHGNEVAVVIESLEPNCWDDAYKVYNRNGLSPANVSRYLPEAFVKVQGCPICTLIQVSSDSD